MATRDGRRRRQSGSRSDHRPMTLIPITLRIAMCLTALVTASCQRPSDTVPDPWRDPSPHRTAAVQVGGLRLQYLSWGDHGEPVVFVHGSGDSPHYFDDIARVLAANYRVDAPARRGHGQSQVPSAPFTLDDLTDDLTGLLDSLHLDKVTLVGFSFGGNEITRFAERFPARVSRLVYLDAAFEQSHPGQAAVFATLPPLPQPTPADFASLTTFRRFAQSVWYPRIEWTPTMEAVLRDFAAVGPDGHVTIPSDSVAPSMTEIMVRNRRNYSGIRCPVLVIVPEHFELPPVGADTTLRATQAKWHAEQFVAYQRALIENLEREISGVRIVRLKALGHNALTVAARDEILAELQTFLASAVPASPPAARP